jgi:hypothetical protein
MWKRSGMQYMFSSSISMAPTSVFFCEPNLCYLKAGAGWRTRAGRRTRAEAGGGGGAAHTGGGRRWGRGGARGRRTRAGGSRRRGRGGARGRWPSGRAADGGAEWRRVGWRRRECGTGGRACGIFLVKSRFFRRLP